MVQILGIVENALAGITGDNLIVSADFLEDLWPDANLADFAHFIASWTDADSTAMFSNTIVSRNQIG